MLNKVKEYLRTHTGYGKSRYLNYLFQYDMKRYFRYSSQNHSEVKAAATEIRILSHTIEKAMSLPDCRAGFGKAKILRLIELYEKYSNEFTNIDPQIKSIVNATVQAYAAFHNSNGVDEADFFDSKYLSAMQEQYPVGVILVPPKQKTDFATIASQRKSARYFGKGCVSRDLVRKAVQIAQTAPSACNRQSIRVYACLNENLIEKVMALHKGVRGFGKPGVVLAITGDLSLYQNELERATVFVDGGLFAMNLLYALDSFGLVSCPIIWGSEPNHDSELASLLGIPENETTVLLIVSGKCPEDGYRSAISAKRSVDDVLHII